MKPTTFSEVNHTYAKDQPEYIPLPGHKVKDTQGEFIFCMKLSIIERIKLLLTCRLWCSLLTFNQPLSPSFFTTNKLEMFKVKLTWLGKVNYYFIQFLYFRITTFTQDENKWYGIQYWVIPMTGWTSDFKYIGKVKYVRLTPKFKK